MTPSTITTVHQILPTFSPHDAIGNEVLLMQETLRDMGFVSEIYAEAWRPPARPFEQVAAAGGPPRTALLYHFCIASGAPSFLASVSIPKLVRYHSITPPWFFNEGNEFPAHQACRLGLRQLPLVGLIADAVIADSQHNAAEIAEYTRVTPAVVPVFRDYDRLVKAATSDYAAPLKASGRRSLLFVGRVAPNKCQHDLLLLLQLARRFIAEDLRLVLVGGFFSNEFRRALLALAAGLGLRVGHDPKSDGDVLFLEGIADGDMASLYRQASAFVSMSEHEGFCVPLVEAMHFELPILAHAAAAVPETLGEAGLLCDKRDWADVLAKLRALLASEPLRERLRQGMRTRRAELGLAASRERFRNWIEALELGS